MVTLEEFYRGKRVLITGHTGFKGAWLSQWLITLGCEVTGYALAPAKTAPNLYSLLGLVRKMDSRIGDIRNSKALRKVIMQTKPDIVFHLAAQSLVLPSYDAPIETFATNIMGTLNLLECVRHNESVKAIVNVTTDKCYENNETATAFREHDKLGGRDPYSASKAAVEIVSQCYRHSFLTKANISMATARAGNVIGGGDFADYRLIPDIVRALQADQPLNLRHPSSIRPWQYVLDVLHGYLLLGQALYEKGNDFAGAFNFAPNEAPMTTHEVATHFTTSLGKPIPLTHANGPAAHEAATLRLDAEKARKLLDWQPTLTTREAIRLTAQWYKHYLTNRKVIVDFTNSQLRLFMSEMS